MKYLAGEIDNFESTAKSNVASAITAAGGTGVSSSSSWSQLTNAIQNLDSVESLISGAGHEYRTPGLPYSVTLNTINDSIAKTAQDTWHKEFNIYKDENGNSALLNCVSLICYAHHHAIYGGVQNVSATYTIKTDNGRVLKSGNLAWCDSGSGSNMGDKTKAACTPIIISLLGTGVGNAQKVIVEVTWDLWIRASAGQDNARVSTWLSVDECNGYYVDN